MFGISCAPEIFQKTMENILVGLKGIIVYLDDVVVSGATEKEHDERLKALRDRLNEYGILLNHDKCVYKVRELEFLGHILNREGIRPTEHRMAAIKGFREPMNISELRSFLGLITYVGRFIPHLAAKTEPLRQLLRAGVVFRWEETHRRAFGLIKEAIGDIGYLGFFNKNDKTKLIADASPNGLGAVLLQENAEGETRIIAYASKALTDLEKKYFQTEREALALVWGVEKFSLYLLGRHFQLITDCKALKFLFNPRSRPCPRIERWVLRLQSYDYEIMHEPGASNLADALSRLSVRIPKLFDTSGEAYVHHLLEYSVPEAVTLKDVMEASDQDAILQELHQALKTDVWNEEVKGFKQFKPELHAMESIIMRGDRLIIPEKLQQKVLLCAHEGHPGSSAMKRRLRQKVWWPKIDDHVEKCVKGCNACILVSSVGPPEPMRRSRMPTRAWSDVAVDFLGPLPSGHNLLVMIDYFSRFTEVVVMKQITAELTIQALFETFSRFGIPEVLRSDHGPQFTSESFKEFCREYGIEQQRTTPYWPQANGEVERMNNTILKRLRISQELGSLDWKWDLRSFLLMYNSTPHSITGIAPSALMFGRVMRDKLPSAHEPTEQLTESIRDRDWAKKVAAADLENKRRQAKRIELHEGDIVVAKRMIRENKLASNFGSEQFQIVKRSDTDAELRSLETGKIYHRNVSHLKPITQSGTQDVGSSNDEVLPDEQQLDIPEVASSSNQGVQPRERRQQKAPSYLQEYVTNVEYINK